MESREQIYQKNVEIIFFIFEIFMFNIILFQKVQSKLKYYMDFQDNLFTLLEYLDGDQDKVYFRQDDIFV